MSQSVELCRRNALHVVKLAWATHPDVRFGSDGVQWLDAYVTASRPNLSDDLVPEFVDFMGSYYGECLIGAFGGVWDFSGSKLGVRTAGLGITFPFAAVERHLAGGPDQSLARSYFAAVELLSEDLYSATA